MLPAKRCHKYACIADAGAKAVFDGIKKLDCKSIFALKSGESNDILYSIGGVAVLDKNDLQAIAELLKPIYTRLDSVDTRLDSIEERLTNVEEDTKITRGAVNRLIEWADGASIQDVPLFKKAK